MARRQPRNNNLTPAQKGELTVMINRQIERNLELKYATFGAQPNATLATPVLTSLTDIAQGTTDLNRIGDSLKLKKLFLNFILSADTTNAASFIPMIRCIVFQWLPNDVALVPVIGQILLPEAFAGTVNHLSHYNVDYHDQYRILYDEAWPLIGVTGIPTSASCITKYIEVNLGPALKRIQFSGATTGGTNKLYVAWMTNVATAAPDIYWSSKVTFTDA